MPRHRPVPATVGRWLEGWPAVFFFSLALSVRARARTGHASWLRLRGGCGVSQGTHSEGVGVLRGVGLREGAAPSRRPAAATPRAAGSIAAVNCTTEAVAPLRV